MSALFSALLLISAMALTSPSPGGEGPCEFYRKKSEALGCKPDEYLIAFGYKYCRAFYQSTQKFSPHGNRVLEKIRQCLIRTLKSHHSLTCSNVKTVAEQSHVRCYKEKGFCDLEDSDKWTILRFVWPELLDEEFRRVTREIREGCG